MCNFYLKDGYHQDIKIIELVEKLPIKKSVYLDKEIVKIILDTCSIDITYFFDSDMIKTIQIYEQQFIITRHKNKNWILIIAVFLSTLHNFFTTRNYKAILSVIEDKLRNYQEYQLKISDNKIIINYIYAAVYNVVGESLQQHGGGFEITEIDKHAKKIHVRLTGNCDGCESYNSNLKSIIIKEIDKILLDYKIFFYN